MQRAVRRTSSLRNPAFLEMLKRLNREFLVPRTGGVLQAPRSLSVVARVCRHTELVVKTKHLLLFVVFCVFLCRIYVLVCIFVFFVGCVAV